MTSLTDNQKQRYERQLRLPQIGVRGQAQLLRSRVLVVGLGGLGSPAVYYLAAAGVGTLGIADADTVEWSNLQRQILYGTGDVGKPKVDVAAARLRAVTTDVDIEIVPRRVEAADAEALFDSYDFVVDATDTFAAKTLINDACVRSRTPFCHAGITAFYAQVMTVVPGQSACYRCVFERGAAAGSPDAAQPVGPLGAIAGLAGTIQAAEAIKCLVSAGQLLTDRVLRVDALDMQFRTVAVKRRSTCAACGGVTEQKGR